jgi:DNA-binding NarL/FixJ family response regulator
MVSGIRRHPPVDLLLVDDDQLFGEALAQRLRREPGVREVEPAYSSDAAWRSLRRQRPDVVILDYNLADASGLALLADIESLPDPPRVLILSGTQEVADIAHAVEYGAAGWVVKGGTLAELLDAVEQALDGDLVLPRGAVGELVRYLLDQLHRRGTSA